jgi:cyclopropane-fatty-acyl-phospholipid synthase
VSLEACRKKIEDLFALADVTICGDRPWDIQVHNDQFYARLLTGGSLALGESYMEGWWDCDRLDEFFCRILRARLDTKVGSWKDFLLVLKSTCLNLQKPARAFRVGECHYDLGNGLYQGMLDRRLIYSCAYWRDAATLSGAQEAKLDLVCRKLGLKPGMRVLDIGCGWGGTAQFIAERYDAEVVGITVSKEQAAFAHALCKGLSVEIRLEDYRTLDEKFDRIVSIGMFEHVGCKNYRTFMEVVRRCTEDDGLFLLQTIGRNRSYASNDPWIEKYIFPNSLLPSAKQISTAAEGVLVVEDWHSFGCDYDKTLMAWYQNFTASWNDLKACYDDRFYRMWTYYLLSCAGSFRACQTYLWQVVFSPEGVPGGYQSVR